ncbi:MAG: hypothetical protein QGF74_03310 [Candidatus Nanoarchaeia archaeon]|jgi:hypothetical protein|nr:hypothetical protein [Candidatus Nanoarchaeia archaeon]|tara:strand:- start:12662 stop:12793 length:132 start_codon:yes stop_codon:yes gene_type:complete
MVKISCREVYKILHPKRGKIVEEIGEELLDRVKEEDKDRFEKK